MFTALHVGDCAVYISYDVDKPRSEQGYVKIANIPDCKSYTTWSIEIPSSLPAGRAILRWDWVALHIWPKTELFVQCADVEIQSASSTKASELFSFSITNPPIYPDDGNDGVGYRNAFGTGAQDMTGPSCIDDSINDCWLTAPGTLRNTDSRRGSGGSGTFAPVPLTTPAAPAPATLAPATAPPQPAPQPQPAPPAPLLAPTPAPAAAGDCVSGGPEYYAAACAALAATCEQYSFCKRVPAGGGAPGASPPAGTCVSNDPSIDYTAACQALEATCELHSFCRRASSLAQLSSATRSAPQADRQSRRLRKTKHHVLLQQGSMMQPGVFADDDESDGVDGDQADSAASRMVGPSRSEL